jgi:glycosyltransferase involved in cell wall biosynthesis
MDSEAHNPLTSGIPVVHTTVGSVTAIVPARNEETTIAPCITSLANQPEIAEILVVNDQSTDATASVVRGLIEKIPNLRLLESGELPDGWVGKNYALWVGVREAKSPWLLFTDADAEHERDSVPDDAP